MSEAKFTTCPRADVAAYLDGELAAEAEAEFERHLAECQTCARRLNEQKRLLCALTFALDDEKRFELPKDFARDVAVRAESNVSGLRDKTERIRAVLLIGALFAGSFLIVLIGNENDSLVKFANGFSKQIFIVGSVLLNFCRDFGIVVAVILRAASRQFFAAPFAGWMLTGLLVFSFVWLSRLVAKYHRA